MTKAKGKSKRKAVASKKGRPTKFQDAMALRLCDLAKRGATNTELAQAAGCGLSTFYAWKAQHPDFREALKACKSVADELVEVALRMRALGYTHRAVKIFCTEGRITTHEYDEHYPPDVGAITLYLKNRMPERWRDVKSLDHAGPGGAPISPPSLEQIAQAVTETIVRSREKGVVFE